MAPPVPTPRIDIVDSYSLRNLYICGLLVMLLYLWEGAVFVWSSPQLLSLRNELHTSTVEDTAIVASCALGATFGPTVGAVLVNRWGGKSLVWLQVCLFLGSFALLTALPLLPYICVGRVLAGLAIGAFLCHLPAYLDDIKEPDMPMSLMRLWLMAVQTLGYSVAHMALDRYEEVIALILSGVIGVVALAWLPQSPYDAVATGHLSRAHAAIQFLQRGISTNGVEASIRQIQDRIAREDREQSNDASLLSSSPSQKALGLTLVLSCLSSLTGASVVLTVLCDIMQQAQSFGGAVMSAGLVMVFVCGASSVIPYYIHNCGHKKILVGSSVVMALSMILFGLYLMNLEKDIEVSHLSWLPILCLFVYLSAFNVGLGVKTDEVISSLCGWNSKLKRFGTTLASTVGFFCIFLVTIAYFLFGNLLGITTVMWTFAFFSLLTAAFVQFFIPETSVMSPSDIETFLN